MFNKIMIVHSLSMLSKFSFNGVRSMMVLYLIKGLLYKDVEAYQLYAGVVSLVYIIPILGGWLHDKGMHHFQLLILGSLTMLVGSISLFMEFDVILGFIFFLVGNGFMRLSVPLMLSSVTSSGSQRESSFILQHAINNLGSLLGVSLCSVIGEIYGWIYGFIISGMASLAMIPLVIILNSTEIKKLIFNFKQKSYNIIFLFLILIGSYILLKNTHILEILSVAAFFMIMGMLINAYIKNIQNRYNILCISYTLFFQVIFMALYGQGFSSLVLFCDRCIEKTILGISLPTTSFQLIDPILSVIMGIIIANKVNNDQKFHFRNTRRKYIVGLLAISMGFALLYAVCMAYENSTSIHAVWLILAYGLLVFSAYYIVPIGNTMISELAPINEKGFYMGAWLFSIAIGEILAGNLSKIIGIPREIIQEANIVGLYKGFFMILMELGFATCLLYLLITYSWGFAKQLKYQDEY